VKKWNLKVTSQYGYVIFDHSSDSAKRLWKLYEKNAYSSDGNMFSDFYFGKIETNMTPEVKYEAYTGKKWNK